MNLKQLVAISTTVWLVACSGGGSDNTPAGPNEIETVTSTGHITDFGSIIINGDEIHTDTATYEKDEDRADSDAEFEKGMVVTIEAQDRDGALHALSVSYDPELEGPISPFMRNTEDGTVIGEINGTRVILNSTGTHFDGTTFEALMENDCLEVDGDMNDKTLVASYATACKPNDDGEFEREFTGVVLEVLPDGYLVDDWTVLTDGATKIEGDPRVGDQVEVECVDTANANECLAGEIEPADRYEPKGDKVKIEGFVENYDGMTTFFIRDHEIDASTVVLPEDFDNGVPVRVHGRRNDNVIVANKIKIAASAAKIKVEGLIDFVGTESFDVRVFDQPVTFRVDMLLTEWDDEDEFIDDRDFRIGDLMVGHFVELKAERDDTGELVALRVEREEDEGHDKITAPVEMVDAAGMNLTLIGVTIAADDATRCRFFKADDSCARFFDVDNGIMMNHLVKAKGARMGNFATELKTKKFGFEFGKDDSEVERKGTIEEYDPDTMTFLLGGVSVDASMARLDPSDLMLMDGLFVEVEGRWMGDVLKADVVELEDEDDGDDGDFEVTGYVFELDEASVCMMLIEGQMCAVFAIDPGTEIEGSVAVGDFVAVEFDEAQVAAEIETKEVRAIKFEGRIDAARQDGDHYEVDVLGVTFRTKTATEFKLGSMEVDATAFFSAWNDDPMRLVELADELPHDGLIDELKMH